MKYDLVVTGGRVVLSRHVQKLNIGVSEGKIDTLTRHDISGREEIDAKGKFVIPGVLDPHMHTWSGHNFETFENASLAAARGGVTTIIDMPLDVPVPDSAARVREKAKWGEETSYVDFALLGGLVPDSILKIPDMAEAGVVGFKVFMDSIPRKGFYEGLDAGKMLEAMECVAGTDLAMCIHGENSFIIDNVIPKLQASGKNNPDVWCDARPPINELEAVSRSILLASETRCKINLCHLSLGKAVEMVVEARRQGYDIYAETCPHYLLLSREDLAKDKRLRANPPLRDPKEAEALWSLLRRGAIQIIGSDHAPLPKEKDKSIWEIFGGCGNTTQFMIALIFTEALYKRNFGIVGLVELFCASPAHLFKLYPRKGTISPGSDADLVVLDVGTERTLSASNLQMLGDKWSPYDGRTVMVSPEVTILRGQTIIMDDKVVGKAGQGIYITPEKKEKS